jgi:hypothetical protein
MVEAAALDMVDSRSERQLATMFGQPRARLDAWKPSTPTLNALEVIDWNDETETLYGRSLHALLRRSSRRL